MRKGFLLLLLAVMSTNAYSTVVSRLELDHPALGTTGGSSLHSSIEAIYTKIGDNVNSRYSEYNGVADSSVTTITHNFGVSIDELSVLIYTGSNPNLTRVTTVGAAGDYQVAANGTNPKTQIDITAPTSGGPHTFAIVVVNGRNPESVGDLDDVDITTTAPEEGQALVWSSAGSEFIPGASGDASFKMQDVTDPNATIKGGYIILPDGKELATYDGSGSTSADYGSDLTVSLDTIFGGDPVNNTTYYVYIDIDSLGAAVTLTDNGRVLYGVQEANFSIQTTTPENVIQSRYVPIGTIHSADSGTVWSGTGSSFETLAFRRHNNLPVTVNPIVYSLEKQVVGSVGSSGQIAAGHELTSDSFNFTFSDDIAFYNMEDVNDISGATSCSSGASACTLTNYGTVVFDGTGILGTSNTAATLNGTSQALSSTDSFFNVGNNDFTMGGWFKATDWTAYQLLISIQNSSADRSLTLNVNANGSLTLNATNTTSNWDHILNIQNPGFTDGTYHHFAVSYESGVEMILYVDGQQAGVLDVTSIRSLTTANFILGATYVPDSFFGGTIDEFFLTKNIMSPSDIWKTFAYKKTHNANVLPEQQQWIATYQDSAENTAVNLDQGWIVNQEKNDIYWDFFGLSSTAKVTVKEKSLGISANIAPVGTNDWGIVSSTAMFGDPTPINIAHGLSCSPYIYLGYEGQNFSGLFTDRKDLCGVDDTNIKCDVTGLTVGGSNRLHLKASCSEAGLAIDTATSIKTGLLLKNKWQRKRLLSDQTADITLTDLTFNNLTIGKVYKVIFHGLMESSATSGTDYLIVDIVHDSIDRGRALMKVDGQASTRAFSVETTAIFEATDTTVTFDLDVNGSGKSLLGHASLVETYALLMELNNYEVETTDFN